MVFDNDTPYECGFTFGPGPEHVPCVGIIVKATFTIPTQRDATATLADEQQPLFEADEYYKGDVTGSVLFETDYVAYKPRADVVLVGHAYPRGSQARVVDVMLRVGRLRKVIRVFGDREWLFPSRMVMVPVISDPEPFEKMPLIYERAFGGFDRKAGKWCAQNFIGRGFLGKKTKESVDGTKLPNLEDPQNLITSWNDEPAPVGFGYYHRNWQPRFRYGGTEQGLDALDLFGNLSDFQLAFNNAAHPDLQLPGYLQGDEEVELAHLTPDGARRFRLPGPSIDVAVHAAPPSASASDEPSEASSASGEETAAPDPDAVPLETTPIDMHLDTLLLVPDEEHVCLVWRGTYPLPDVDTLDDLEQATERIRTISVRPSDA
ncbi:MAG: DUF2169 domain-containing protein [Bacteroidetes bacterium]|jgi:hypothetical protein|nr:DUF2169 domain-containing protein [Bacteroidota bacterium]